VFRRVEDGEVYTMCFGGPWEADIDAGWVNYKAPLAQSLMGKKIGDQVDFDHTGVKGRYEIVALGSALEDEEAHSAAPQTSGKG